ncbi:GNAT family N-acetyltransferase [Kribbella catacumbae]|uniref:GNAT family N-acetyltransferase n=1 Tax=Kribbella catacumbae TaxID=460086 RepID=UPI0006883E8A|nr:GNAT family N-acetyltransferase [Kribbella catacumbae]
MRTLARAWADGWAISRGTPAPVEVPEGYRIDVGLPGHLTRYVLPTHAPELAARLTAPDTWLKVCADPATVPLDERWQVQPTEYLMSIRLTAELPACAPEYELEAVQTGSVVDVVLGKRGELAARGKAALSGEYAVIDQVITEPEHRRRGLGSIAMQALAQAAVARGTTTGVLVATADGRALYSRLGWVLVTPVTAARLCVPGRPASRADLPRG